MLLLGETKSKCVQYSNYVFIFPPSSHRKIMNLLVHSIVIAVMQSMLAGKCKICISNQHYILTLIKSLCLKWYSKKPVPSFCVVSLSLFLSLIFSYYQRIVRCNCDWNARCLWFSVEFIRNLFVSFVFYFMHIKRAYLPCLHILSLLHTIPSSHLFSTLNPYSILLQCHYLILMFYLRISLSAVLIFILLRHNISL